MKENKYCVSLIRVDDCGGIDYIELYGKYNLTKAKMILNKLYQKTYNEMLDNDDILDDECFCNETHGYIPLEDSNFEHIEFNIVSVNQYTSEE